MKIPLQSRKRGSINERLHLFAKDEKGYVPFLSIGYGGPQVSRQFILKLRYIKSKITANKNFIVRIKIFVAAQII